MIDKKISVRQAGILIIICLMANKILLLPSLMFQQIKSDSIFAIILMFSLDLIFLPIFLKLKSLYPNEKLIEIISKKMSKIVAKIIYIIFAIYFIFKVLLVFSITYVYFKQQIYQDEFLWLIIISCLPVINHALTVGLRAFSRTIELLFSIVIVGFILCLAFSLFTEMSMPILFVSDIKSFFSSIYKHAFSFGDYLFLFVIIDKIDIKKGDSKKLYEYSIFGMILVILLFIIFFSKYQVTAFMHNNALADILVFSIQFNAIGRLDIIAMLTIMSITLFQLEIFAYGFCDSFINLFPKLNKFVVILFFDLLFALLYYFSIGKYEILVNTSHYWSPMLGIFVNYVFPIICLIIIALSRRRKNERKY